MAESKTKPNAASVEAYLAAIENAGRRSDCETLAKLMIKATKQAPEMWGTAIVGFGTHKYQLAGGREGDTFLLGFSSRKGDIKPIWDSERTEPRRTASQTGQTQNRRRLPLHRQAQRRKQEDTRANLCWLGQG